MRYCNIIDKEDIKPKVIEALRRTKEANKEHGFNFCVSNGNPMTTYVEEGEKDSLWIGNRCQKGAKIIGGLHIHTKPSLSKDVVPSPTDIKKGIAEKLAFFCIGVNVDNHGIVRCFSRQDLESEMSNIISKAKFSKVGLREMSEEIDKSSKLMTGRMAIYRDYIDKHSCQRIFA